MNVIRNKAILAVLPLLVSLALPVMAQTATTTVATKAPVNSLGLNEKGKTCSRKLGMCGKGRFEGGTGGFKADRGNGHRFFHRSMFSSLRGENALTDSQLEKMALIKNGERAQAQPKVSDLISTERQLKDQLSKPDADKSQILSLQAQINGDRDALSNLKLNTKLQEMDLLTGQQKQELRHDSLKRTVEFGRG